MNCKLNQRLAKRNPHIVKLWTEVGNAAMKAIKEKTIVSLGKLVFMYERGILFIRLPSGRRLSYIKPRIGTNRFGGDSITYMGVGAIKEMGTTRNIRR